MDERLHCSAATNFYDLREGDRVSFDPKESEKGPRRKMWRCSRRRCAEVVSGNLVRPLIDVDRFCLALEATTVEDAAGQLFREVERDDTLLRATWPMYEQTRSCHRWHSAQTDVPIDYVNRTS